MRGRKFKIIIRKLFFHGQAVEFDYSLIRKLKKPIKDFGGVSSGEPLEEVHEDIRQVLESNTLKTNHNHNHCRYYELNCKCKISVR